MLKSAYHNTTTIEPRDFRVKHELQALLFSSCLILLVALAISTTVDKFVFIGLVGIWLLYIKLKQLQYLGNAIRVTIDQYPSVYTLLQHHEQRLGLVNVPLYIKQDPVINAFTVGLTTPAIVLHSALVEQLTEEELSFVIGHELGHIKAKHTFLLSLTQPLGGGNLFSNIIFMFWRRKAEYTADRCGLLLTKKINPAIKALLKLSIGGKLIRDLNISAYMEQIRESGTLSVRLSEVIMDHPLFTNRINTLHTYWQETPTLRSGSDIEGIRSEIEEELLRLYATPHYHLPYKQIILIALLAAFVVTLLLWVGPRYLY